MKSILTIVILAIVTGVTAVTYANDTLNKVAPLPYGVHHTLQADTRSSFIAQPSSRTNLQYKTNAVNLQPAQETGELQPAID